MRFALAALYFGASHAMTTVGFGFHGLFIRWSIKAGPSGAGMKLGLGRK
jgi:hypothetical protein